MGQNSLTHWGEQNSLTPYGNNNNNMNYGIARDQVMYPELSVANLLPPSIKQTIFSQFVLFFELEGITKHLLCGKR